MGVVSGKSQAFIFNGTTYDADDCIQDGGLDDAINEVVYQCNGMDKSVAGTRSAMFNVTLALEKTDVTQINALNPGDTGALVIYPAGTTAGNIKYSAAAAIVETANFSLPVNGFYSVDLSIRLNDITIGAAT
jgi:hypothetical protein